MINFRKARAVKALKKANMAEDAYLVIKQDKEDGFAIYEYVKKGENLKNYIAYYPDSTYTIEEVYNLSLDIDMQLAEPRSYHTEKYINPIENEELQQRALEFAKKKHEGQFRKSGEPYINHPISVAGLIKKFKGNSKDIDDLVCAAYLHDTLEDTNTTFNELVDIFNVEIAYLVSELTTDDKMKQEMGKEKYLSYKLSSISDWALDLKLCDRLDNISDLNESDLKFRVKYFFETLHIIDYLLKNRKLTSTQRAIIEKINNILKTVEIDTRKLVKDFKA